MLAGGTDPEPVLAFGGYRLAKGFALDIPVSLVATVSVVCEPWAFSRPRLASLNVATHAVSKGEQNSRNVAHNRLKPVRRRTPPGNVMGQLLGEFCW